MNLLAIRRVLRSDLPFSLAVWLVGALVFFRAQWQSGFRNLMGNGGDSAFIVYILEHWFQVLHGQVSWANPPMYFPVKGLLGWSDALILFEVFYAPLRLMGADQLLAAQLTLVLLSLIGFVAFVRLMRILFAPPLWLALGGALVFAFANNLWVNAGHYQLLAIWLVPVVALLAVDAWRTESRRRSVVMATLAGLAEGLLFFTSYYVAWLCLPLLLLALLAGLGLRPGGLTRTLVGQARRLWPAVAGAVGGFAVAMVPFLDVYLPARSHVPAANYHEVISGYGIRWRGLFDVGPGNLVWSQPLRHLVPGIQFPAGQAASEVTPVLMVAAVVASALALLLSPRSGRAVAAAALAIAAVIGCLLTVQFSGHSLWILVWHLPGGNAIRAIDRIELLTSAMAVTSLVAAASELWAAPRSGGLLWWRAAIGIAVTFVLVEQLNTGAVSALDRPATLAFIDAIPAPPASCRSFYMAVSGRSPVPGYAFQSDAILAAQRLRLPTLDGYTSYSPAGWDLGTNSPDYPAEVIKWVDAHHLRGVCQLDATTMTWSEQAGASGQVP